MLKSNPNPTFKATVSIPVPGDQPAEKIVVEYKYRTKKQVQEFGKDTSANLGDPELIMLVASGWDGVEDPFTLEGISNVCDKYAGAGSAIVQAYFEHLLRVKAGN